MDRSPAADPIPAQAGIGLRLPHQAQVLASRPRAAWLEVHPENYMADAPALAELELIGEHYPLSLHAVGLSLGSAEGVDQAHLERLCRLVQRLQARPGLGPSFLERKRRALPAGPACRLPYTEEALRVVCRNVEQVQAALGRTILVENPSTYLQFAASAIPEAEFLAAVARAHRLRRVVRREQCLRQRFKSAPRRRSGARRVVPRS